MEHTKGEWVTNETGLIRSKEGVMIAQKLSADNNDSEAAANAKLIAAAPELLEALQNWNKQFANNIKMFKVKKGKEKEVADSIRQWVNALEKATS